MLVPGAFSPCPTYTLDMATTTAKAPAKTKRQRPAYDGPTPEEKIVAGLIELMEAGTTPWQREWRGSRRGQHRNLITGAEYHGSNPALLELQLAMRGSQLPLWAGHGQAKAKGWVPKKGSKGCYIVRPQLNSYEETDDKGQPVLNDNGDPKVRSWTSFKPTCVFNANDLQGDGLAEAIAAAMDDKDAEERSEPERHQLAESVLSNWVVDVNWGGDRAFYSPTADRISLPQRKQFVDASGLYATWAHEAIHSTGHQDRLGRDGIVNFAGFGSDTYAREELVAELGAFLLANRLQIDSRIENHASYLNSWISCLKAKPKLLFQSLSEATKAANLIYPETLTPAE